MARTMNSVNVDLGVRSLAPGTRIGITGYPRSGGRLKLMGTVISAKDWGNADAGEIDWYIELKDDVVGYVYIKEGVDKIEDMVIKVL